jgi:hypothetical protein
VNNIEYSVHPWGTGAAANIIGTGFRFLIQSGRCRLKQFAGFCFSGPAAAAGSIAQ